jgi:hypothetical protein
MANEKPEDLETARQLILARMRQPHEVENLAQLQQELQVIDVALENLRKITPVNPA